MALEDKSLEIEVRLYATLRQFLPNVGLGEGHTMRVSDGTTVASLLEALGVPAEMTKQVFVNARQVEFDYIVRAGDRVAIFPPIAGGLQATRPSEGAPGTS